MLSDIIVCPVVKVVERWGDFALLAHVIDGIESFADDFCLYGLQFLLYACAALVVKLCYIYIILAIADGIREKSFL